MYKRNAQGWSKHFDFIIVDEISLQIAFVLAVLYRLHAWAYAIPLYRTMGITLVLVDAVILVLLNSMHDVVKRGLFSEAMESFNHCFYVFAFATIYMFATKTGDEFSRIILFLTSLLHYVLIVREFFGSALSKDTRPNRTRKKALLLLYHRKPQKIFCAA